MFDPQGDKAALAVKTLVDRATYVRDLLVSEAGRLNAIRKRGGPNTAGFFPLTVELVIVAPIGRRRGNDRDALSEALDDISRDTAYLESVGVNVLYRRGNEPFGRSDLRRAFSWLLGDTEVWFDAVVAASGAQPQGSNRRGANSNVGGTAKRPSANVNSFDRIVLENYRLPGERQFERHGDATFHVLHGHNGSGKSAFVEALELLLTGAIERLERAGEKDYYKVIRHDPGQVPGTGAPKAAAGNRKNADVLVRVQQGKKEEKYALPAARGKGSSDRKRPPGIAPGGFSPGSFRLDQTVMDQLIRSNETERARLLLRSFFPEARETFEELEQDKKNARDAALQLPGKIREELPAAGETLEKAILERFEWLGAEPNETRLATVPFETAATCLPLSEQKLRLLSQIQPSIGEVLDRWKRRPIPATRVKQEIEKLDSYLQTVLDEPAVMERLEATRKILDELRNWQARRGRDRGTEDLEATLNKWLATRALLDLANQYSDVMATFPAAGGNHWSWPQGRDPFPGLKTLTPKQLEALKHECNDLSRSLDSYQERLAGWSDKQETKAAGGVRSRETRPPRHALNHQEIEWLNDTGQWLASVRETASQRRLGTVCNDALAKKSVRTIGRIAIGKPGGVQRALDEIGRLLSACRELSELRTGERKSLDLYDRCRTAYETFKKQRQAGSAVRKTFFEKIAGPGEGAGEGLNGALNELLALFKPARWAYQDIRLRAPEQNPDSGLAMETHDRQRADLRLNTAELNSLTVALFLLCAVRVKNPLRVLVLDDPLQNMDELTVTALARGLAKVMRIFPAEWQILALFHGQEDLARIRDEVPCAVYFFPWLKPVSETQTAAVGIEHSEEFSNKNSIPQPIGDLFANIPAA